MRVVTLIPVCRIGALSVRLIILCHCSGIACAVIHESLPSLLLAVPSPVVDIMVSVWPRMIDLFWSTPLYPNGELLTYIVSFTGEFTLNSVTEEFYDSVMAEVNVSDSPMTSLLALEPFSNYTITLSAVNSAGEGNVTEIGVMTPEDG